MSLLRKTSLAAMSPKRRARLAADGVTPWSTLVPSGQRPLMRAGVPASRRARPTGPTPDVVQLVRSRAAGRCECCRIAAGTVRGTDFHIHHRRPRGSGGSRRLDTNMPQNLLLLCPGCHAGVESRRADAIGAGLLVSQHADPAQVAVLLAGDRWVYLTCDGGYSDKPAGVAS